MTKKKSDQVQEELSDKEDLKNGQSEGERGIEDRLVEIEEELAASKDKYLRLFAEFDNFKKRSMKERLGLMKSAAQDAFEALLPVLDDFDRAKKSAEDEDSAESFSEGVSLVYHKLYNILQNKGLRKMESTGKEFDPELHDAVTEIPAPDKKMKGKVIDTIEPGYYLNDKIIRHAKVVVGK